jgi:hypothetical protein
MIQTKSIARMWRLPMLALIAAVFVVGLLPSSASAGIPGTIAGVYEIKNANSKRCLSVNGGYSSEVKPMEQFTCGGWAYQRFQFRYTNYPDLFLIHPKSKPHMCLGMVTDGNGDGIPLEQQQCPRDQYGNIVFIPRQMFSLQQVATFPDGNVRVRLKSFMGRCLQVNNASKDNHARISQWDCSPPGNPNTMHYYWDFKWVAHS